MFEEVNDLQEIRETKIQEINTLHGYYDRILSLCEEQIREECKGVYINKARRLFEMGFFDHAVLEYWNRAMTDLKDKLTIYGLEHLPSELNLKVKTREDLSHVKDSIIIEACYLLGIIDNEAHIFLKHCLTIRNNFSAAHDTDSPIDPIEAINLIKNCVKYVLQKDVPSPAMTINDLLKYIQSASFEKEHFSEIIQDQSPKVVESFLRRVFIEYIDPKTTKEYRDNLKMVIKSVWNIVGEEVKSELGQKLLHLKLDDEVDKSLYAIDFMLHVKGIKYIPVSVRKHLFIKKAKALLEAHFGFNNFYSEVTPAKELEALGYDVPDEALNIYVKSIIFSFTGNAHGYSHGAAPYTQVMIENLSTKGVEQFLISLTEDKEYAWHFTSIKPAKRLATVFEILRDKSNLLSRQKAKIEEYLKIKSLREHFISLIQT